MASTNAFIFNLILNNLANEKRAPSQLIKKRTETKNANRATEN